MPGIQPHLLACNFRPGRRARISTIVIHATEGDKASVLSWFTDPKAEVSSHYLVCADGTILQFVSERDEAWAQGRVDHPTAAIVLAQPAVNPNAYCVAIEHENLGRTDLTPVQHAASAWLIADIARRNGLALSRVTVIGHHEIYSLKRCPDDIVVDTLVRDAAAQVATPAGDTTPRVVWSPALNDYVLAVTVVSDAEWSFVPLTQIRRQLPGTAAATPLSHMPLHPATP